jgi:hypothetical protein
MTFVPTKAGPHLVDWRHGASRRDPGRWDRRDPDGESDDFMPQVLDIITVGEFFGKAAGGQIIFT